MIRIVARDHVAYDFKGIDGALMVMRTLPKLLFGDDHATTPTHVTLNSVATLYLLLDCSMERQGPMREGWDWV